MFQTKLDLSLCKVHVNVAPNDFIPWKNFLVTINKRFSFLFYICRDRRSLNFTYGFKSICQPLSYNKITI